MDRTMDKAQIGAILSNTTKTHLGCCVLHVKNTPEDAKVMCMFSRKIDIGLYPIFFVASKVTYQNLKRGKVVNSVMVVP
jgi:hypothetical protein